MGVNGQYLHFAIYNPLHNTYKKPHYTTHVSSTTAIEKADVGGGAHCAYVHVKAPTLCRQKRQNEGEQFLKSCNWQPATITITKTGWQNRWLASPLAKKRYWQQRQRHAWWAVRHNTITRGVHQDQQKVLVCYCWYCWQESLNMNKSPFAICLPISMFIYKLQIPDNFAKPFVSQLRHFASQKMFSCLMHSYQL